MAAPTIRFLYDVQCPYAFLASQRVERLAHACKANLEYFPVLLGGLYEGSKAPQGKDGSASDVMALQKQKVNAEDLQREIKRWKVEFKWQPRHPVRSVHAQRLLAGIKEQEKRVKLTHALFSVYWQQEGDVSDVATLYRVAQSSAGVTKDEVDQALSDKDTLRSNTEWAVGKGVFGVPTFFVSMKGEMDTRFFYGGDRTFFLAQHLGVPRTQPFGAPLRLYTTVKSTKRPKIEWFHDFSSPWSYLSSTQVYRIASEHGADVVARPILLGALFKSIGTPNVPMFAMSEAKRAYMAKDMEDWKQWWGDVPLTFPQGFPIRTVNSLRISIAEPMTVPILYEAAWVRGLNIGEDSVLSEVLSKKGFNGPELLRRAKEDPSLKETLMKNTSDAKAHGVCGVPSFSVEGGPVIWGQDRFNVVEDEVELSKRKADSSKL